MKLPRALLALAILAAGVLPSVVLYASNEDGSLWNWGLWRQLSMAALAAASSFLITRSAWPDELRSVVVGVLLSYGLWLGFLMAVDPSSLMWLVVIVVFGIPFTAPIMVGAWFASGLLLPLFASEQVGE